MSRAITPEKKIKLSSSAQGNNLNQVEFDGWIKMNQTWPIVHSECQELKALSSTLRVAVGVSQGSILVLYYHRFCEL